MIPTYEFGELMDESEEELDERLDTMSIDDPMLVPILMQRDYISRQGATDDALLTSLASIGLAVYAIMISLSLYYYEIYDWPVEITILAAVLALVFIIVAIFILYFTVKFLRYTTIQIWKSTLNLRQILRRNQKQ